ncbi:MAG: DUF547 domain-containing protein [Planctomycetota bacterium]|nr:DUF547 domain-containing protein [Planctomycetota bacterium]MDG2143345.1 DUF547 domain-containing protein [Planctomycetota bacterium]
MKTPQHAALALAFLLSACSCASDEPKTLGPGTSTALNKQLAFDQQHPLLDELLAEFVTPSGVRYADLAMDRGKLDRYLSVVQSVSPTELASWTRNQRYAFWINTYNAHILALIAANYPVESIRDLGGAVFGQVWDLELIPMGAHNPDGSGDNLSFGDIEHEILRPDFQDARVHAAINCASESCPPLLPEAFVADRLDTQLTGVMEAFLGDPSRNLIDRASDHLQLSSIFDWFAEDFELEEGSVQAYVARHGGLESTDWLSDAKLSYLDYSWALNDAGGAGE